MPSETIATPKNYRPCVGICLIHAQTRHVFVGERIDTPKAWQMPQGGIDAGEDIAAAALRELKEETGIKESHVKILRISDQEIFYDFPDDLRSRLWNGKFDGQSQRWVALEFHGADSDINITSHAPPEFSQWQWVTLHETVNLIVPFKRKTYEQVITQFEDLVIA
ncbi:MAG: RNA pyrophosphohydrolase [Alphaproteobacteria bacterium]